MWERYRGWSSTSTISWYAKEPWTSWRSHQVPNVQGNTRTLVSHTGCWTSFISLTFEVHSSRKLNSCINWKWFWYLPFTISCFYHPFLFQDLPLQGSQWTGWRENAGAQNGFDKLLNWSSDSRAEYTEKGSKFLAVGVTAACLQGREGKPRDENQIWMFVNKDLCNRSKTLPSD